MKIQSFFFNLSLIIVLAIACQPAKESIALKNEIIYSPAESPYHITQNITIDSTMKLIILPGTQLIFHDATEIQIYGSLQIKGTNDKPITLIPSEKDSLWGGIKFFGPSDTCILENVIVKNGLIWGENTDVVINNYTFFNNFKLGYFDAIIRFYESSVQIKDSYFESNHSGEGLIIIDPKQSMTLIENCEFKRVSDAIEYIHSYKNGIIRRNIIKDVKQINGDAIDLNGCHEVLVEGNYIENIRDFGIEIGHDKFGSCKDIIVSNNTFISCYSGVGIKGGSNAFVIHNTFYKNTYGLSCLYNENISNFDANRLEVVNSIFSESKKADFLNNENSLISFECSLSDGQLFSGNANIFADPLFKDSKKGDFTLKTNSSAIGNAKAFNLFGLNFECNDIGAGCKVN